MENKSFKEELEDLVGLLSDVLSFLEDNERSTTLDKLSTTIDTLADAIHMELTKTKELKFVKIRVESLRELLRSFNDWSRVIEKVSENEARPIKEVDSLIENFQRLLKQREDDVMPESELNLPLSSLNALRVR